MNSYFSIPFNTKTECLNLMDIKPTTKADLALEGNKSKFKNLTVKT